MKSGSGIFKCPPGAVIIFLEFIGREPFRLGWQSICDGGQFFNHLSGILF